MLFSPENPYTKLLEDEHQFLPFKGDKDFESKYKTYKDKVPLYDRLRIMTEEDENFFDTGMEQFSLYLEDQEDELSEYVTTANYMNERYGSYITEGEGYFNKYDEQDLENIEDLIDIYGFTSESIYNFIEHNLSDLDPIFLDKGKDNSGYVIIGSNYADTVEDSILIDDSNTIEINDKKISILDFIRSIPEEILPRLIDKYFQNFYYLDEIKKQINSVRKKGHDIELYVEVGDQYNSTCYVGVNKSEFIEKYIKNLKDEDELLQDDDNSMYED